MDNKRPKNLDETLPSKDITVTDKSISLNSRDETLNTVDSDSYSARSTARCEDQRLHCDVCSFLNTTPDNLHHEDRDPKIQTSNKQSDVETQSGQTETGTRITRKHSNTETQSGQTETGTRKRRKLNNPETQSGQTETGTRITRKLNNPETQSGQTETGTRITRKYSNPETQSWQTETGTRITRKHSNPETQSGQTETGTRITRKLNNPETQSGKTETGTKITRKHSNPETQSGQTETETRITRKHSNSETQSGQTETGTRITRKQNNPETQSGQTETVTRITRKHSNTDPQPGQTKPGSRHVRKQSHSETQSGVIVPEARQARNKSNTKTQSEQTEPGISHTRKQINTKTFSEQTEIETRHGRKQSNTETHNGRTKQESKPSHGRTGDRNSDPVTERTTYTTTLLHTAPAKLPSSYSDPNEDKQLHSVPKRFEGNLNNCEDETVLTKNNFSDETYCIDSNEYKPKAPCSKCQKAAAVYCLHCASYMCPRCERRHDKESPLKKKHSILKGGSFPGSFTVKQINRNEKCPNHSDKDVTYFCEDHTALCCSECTSQNHVSCSLQSLEELLINTDVKKLKQDCSKEVGTKLESFLKIRQKLVSNNNMSLIEEERIIKEVEERSEKMVKHIRHLEKQFINKIKDTNATVREHTKTDMQQCDSYITKVSKDVQYIGQPKTTKDNKILTVVKLKQIQIEHLPDYEHVEKTLAGETRKVYEYKINKELCDHVMQSSAIGVIECNILGLDLSETTDSDEMNTSMHENSPCTSNNVSTCVLPERYVIDFISISCWAEGDIAPKTTITAIELLDDGSLVMSDQKNKKLKWFDADFKLITFEELSSAPWGITRLSGTTYLVNLPEEQAYLEFEIFAGGLRLGQKVYIGFEFTCAVEIESKRFIFAGFDGRHAQIVTTDMSGSDCRQLLSEQNRALFRRPNHMVKSNMDIKIIYISDVDRGLFAVDTEYGNVLMKYSDPTLKCSMGLTINEHSEIVLCSAQSRSLHLVSSTDGTRYHTVALEQIRNVTEPQAICFLPHLGEYLMSSDGSYNIVKFKLA